MATVRITGRLIDDVRAYINRARNVEMAAYPSTLTFTSRTTVETLRGELWGEQKHLKDALPPNWCTRVDYLQMRFQKDGKEISIQLPSGAGIFLPPGFYSHSQYKRMYQHVMETPGYEELRPFLEAEFAKLDARMAIHQKYELIANQVSSFLRGCKSLNDAAKKYPDILLWIPQEYKDRLNEAVDRTRKTIEESVPEIDRELITTAGVLNAIQSK